MDTPRILTRNGPVLTYFALTFAISWGGVLAAVVGSGGMDGTGPTSDPRFLYAVLAMLAGPSISGIFMTAVLEGRNGVRALGARVLRCQVGARWYAIALLTAPVLWLLTLFALSFTSLNVLPGIVTSTDKAGLVLAGVAVALAVGILEEIGWTGFAIPHLRRRHGTFVTGAIVGVPWGAWHLLTNVLWAAPATAGELPLSIFLPASVLGALMGYLLLPIDLVPDFIPVLGYADDALIVAVALRWVVRRAGRDVVTRHWPGTVEGLGAVQRLSGLAMP